MTLKKGLSLRSALLGLTAAALCIAAVTMIGVHLRPTHNAFAFKQTAPEAALRGTAVMGPSTPMGGVNINTATADELDELPGVGPVIAGRIIEEREKNGAFAYPEDLLGVKGIGEKTLQRLLESICLK